MLVVEREHGVWRDLPVLQVNDLQERVLDALRAFLLGIPEGGVVESVELLDSVKQSHRWGDRHVAIERDQVALGLVRRGGDEQGVKGSPEPRRSMPAP